ncbi:hypothetical protein [Candidatus Enterococcus clewellii]|uniref:Uncharacterized protein n=1 Tax=Candidatus Enterococcus clewellii TaxID=1834193 RepID=A0A242K8V4_9ENTE|nr:hypothetical protein [Enterococcus sp. 9E7_DIV0242]OTP17582.1 hypothetical protein A5888_001720 [Enterococcus sp. 9E7_DIV0242]
MTEQIIITTITVAGTVLVAFVTAIQSGNKKILDRLGEFDNRLEGIDSRVENVTDDLKEIKRSNLQATIFRLIEKAYRDKKISDNDLSELFKAYDEYKGHGWNSHTTVRVRKFEEDLSKGVISLDEKRIK